MSSKANTALQNEIKLPKTGHIRAFKLAPVLGISISTMYRWIEKGKLPKPIKLSDRVTVFDAVEINNWLDGHKEVAI